MQLHQVLQGIAPSRSPAHHMCTYGHGFRDAASAAVDVHGGIFGTTAYHLGWLLRAASAKIAAEGEEQGDDAMEDSRRGSSFT